MMKVIAEVHRVHLIKCLRFIIITEKRGNAQGLQICSHSTCFTILVE